MTLYTKDKSAIANKATNKIFPEKESKRLEKRAKELAMKEIPNVYSYCDRQSYEDTLYVIMEKDYKYGDFMKSTGLDVMTLSKELRDAHKESVRFNKDGYDLWSILEYRLKAVKTLDQLKEHFPKLVQFLPVQKKEKKLVMSDKLKEMQEVIDKYF